MRSDAENGDGIDPAEYAEWRGTPLGALTERIEQAAVFGLAGDLAGKSLLDLGCGDGAYSIAAFQKGARVAGIDISEAMLDSAQRRASACGAAVDWRRAPAESLPFEPGSFDVVLAVTLLCFVSDPAQVIREARRVLRPGGRLVIGELGRYSSWAASRRIKGWLGSTRWRDAHFWTIGELRLLLQEGGFQAGASRGCVYYPPLDLAARIVGGIDRSLSFLGQFGAAFLAVSGEKPR